MNQSKNRNIYVNHAYWVSHGCVRAMQQEIN
jgi:hypothetical protein